MCRIFHQLKQSRLWIIRQNDILKYKISTVDDRNIIQKYNKNTQQQKIHEMIQIYTFKYLLKKTLQILYYMNIRRQLITLVLLLPICIYAMNIQKDGDLPAGFSYLQDVDSSIIIQPRYAIPGNFIGQIVKGYLKPTVIISTDAAVALRGVQKTLRQLGYGLVVYDAYRPQKAVDDFIRWSKSPEDNKTKKEFYPYIDKQRIIPDGYVAEKSGHSRGSTVDLTIIRLGKEVTPIKLVDYTLKDGRGITYRDDGTEFMCGHFDLFDNASHHDTDLIDSNCSDRRNLLRNVMQKWNFRPLKQEWWHYTLINEPFPNTYFDFDVK